MGYGGGSGQCELWRRGSSLRPTLEAKVLVEEGPMKETGKAVFIQKLSVKSPKANEDNV
jgi:hypothetical protein